MNWILLTFISSLASAVTQVLQKALIKDKNSDPIAFSFVFQLMVAFIFLTYSVTTGTFNQPDLGGVWKNIVAMSLLYGLGSVFTFYAYKTAEASEISVIFATSALWSVIAATFLLDEKIEIKQGIGMLFVLLSLVIVNIRRTSWNVGRGHVMAILGAAMFGIAFTNDAFILNKYESVPSYMVIAFALPSFVSLVFKPRAVFDIPHFFKLKVFFGLMACSIFYSLAAISIFSAFKAGGQASVVNMLRQSGIVFTVLLSFVFLKERDNMRNKVIGVILAMVGGLLLV
jgi:drug/metabolite transporter (DMT)-like permease